MIAGHFGFAAAVKSREREVPLWTLMLACQWLDVIFVPLYVAGIERMVPVEGGGYGKVVIYADWTHSLLGALLLSALFGAFFWSRGRRAFAVLALVSFSHWVLDAVVHRADMPLLPANALGLPRIGFGLWRFPAATAGVELFLVVAGAALYWRAALSTGAQPRANLAGAVLLASGLLTLGLNLLGL